MEKPAFHDKIIKKPATCRWRAFTRFYSYYFAFLHSFNSIYANLFARFVFALEAHPAVYGGKQGIVPAYTHIVAGMKARAALTYDDAARGYELTVAAL